MPNDKINKALLTAVYEYLLITVPVGLYVGLETSHKHNPSFFFISPEWAMATIFLLFQGISLYLRHLSGSGGRVSANNVGVLALISLVVISITVVNAYRSLDAGENTTTAVVIRLLVFVVVSIAFFALVGAAKLYSLRRGGRDNA